MEKQITEKVVIKNCTIVETKEGQRMFILHTTPSKVNPPREGEKTSRFKINEKVFENLAKSQGKPAILFMKEIIGGSYSITVQPVKAGEPFLRGEGTYNKDHNAKVSESIELSAATIAEDTAAMRSAYYANLFGSKSATTTPAVVKADLPAVSGEDVEV